MHYNSYYWELYKQTNQGIEFIDLFEKKDIKAISLKLKTNTYIVDLTNEEIERVKKTKGKNLLVGEKEIDYTKHWKVFFANESFENPKEKFIELINRDLYLSVVDFTLEKQKYSVWLNEIHLISSALYLTEDNFFIPFYFESNFYSLERIFEYFTIPIPRIPKKKDWLERVLYYIELCEVLYEFRITNKLSRAEICAFLYDFAPNVIKQTESDEMPKPTKVWFCGANKNNFEYLDSSNESNVGEWQGNVETRKGDIIVMYCLSPRSYIHSIWRAERDGFIDPFFHFYSMVYISNPIFVKKISQKELEENSIFSKNALVRKNLQGINGYPISFEEYEELLCMLKEKGQNIEELPRIEPHIILENIELNNERDVEINLVEPLLKRLEFETNDWVRQMPVKMGRGERNYPDYCFGANQKRGEETARMILETKYSIRNSKELQNAYYQAKSYAMRLQAIKFILASKEGIWIFEQVKGVFNFNENIAYTWFQLEHPDNYHSALKLIGKKTII